MYLIIHEAGILDLSSVAELVSLEIADYLSRVFVRQVERISRELRPSSAFALHQEGVVWAWHWFITSRVSTK